MTNLVTAFMFLIFWCLPTQDGDGWNRFKNEPNLIEFEMPFKPQIIQQEDNGIVSTIFQSKDLTTTFGIVASRCSGEKFDNSNYVKAYEDIRDGTLSDDSFKLISEDNVIQNRMPIKEIKYSAIIRGKEFIYYKRILFRGSFAYQFSVGAKSKHIDYLDANRVRFFNSINLLNEPAIQPVDSTNIESVE